MSDNLERAVDALFPESGSQDEAGPTIRILVRRTSVEVVVVEVLGTEFDDFTMSAAEVNAEEVSDDNEWNLISRDYEAIREARDEEVGHVSN